MRVLIVLSLIGVTFASEAFIAPASAPALAYSSFYVDEPKPSYEYSTSVQTPTYNNYAHVRSGPEFERRFYNFATPIAAPIVATAEPVITEARILAASDLKAAPVLKSAPLSAELKPILAAPLPLAAPILPATKLLPLAVEAKPIDQRLLPVYRFAPAAAILPVEPAPATIVEQKVLGEKSQYHSQNSLGEATYGHREPLQAHDAIQDAEGNKAGSFSYVAPDGRILTTEYVADRAGYRVASNALPVVSAPLPSAPATTVAEKPAEAISESGDGIVVEAKSRSRRSLTYTAPAVKSGRALYYTSPYAYAYQPQTYSYSYAPYSALSYNAYSAPLYRSYAYAYPSSYYSYTLRK